jgi:hypothetical protein
MSQSKLLCPFGLRVPPASVSSVAKKFKLDIIYYTFEFGLDLGGNVCKVCVFYACH